jgi:hypothetical protein
MSLLAETHTGMIELKQIVALFMTLSDKNRTYSLLQNKLRDAFLKKAKSILSNQLLSPSGSTCLTALKMMKA